MKKIGKVILLSVLAWQLHRLRQRHQHKVVAVVGSYGKTSTKFAIATVLEKHFRVRYQAGNYNDIITVPLIFFGEALPSLINVIAWIRLLIRNERQIRGSYPYDIVVVELGIDGPGQMIQFSRYLYVDLAVVTAIAHEHAEYFTDLQAIADEELRVADFSERLLLNSDLCEKKYTERLTIPYRTYAINQPADYQSKITTHRREKECSIDRRSKRWLSYSKVTTAKAERYSACAAAAIGDQFGMTVSEITDGIIAITPPSGRMQWLKGIHESTILDETYNASPDAMRAALDVLYDLKAPSKIALLGNMNELGKYSQQAHTEVGAYCNPDELDVVVTIGPQANRYLAAAARERGCRVVECTDPYQAGRYLQEHMQKYSAILVKGSQNGVFAEEAIKMILENPEDQKRLVRQSAYWLKVKRKALKR